MGAAGLWAGRPSWRGAAKWGAGVSDISMHPASTCHPAVVRDSVGTVSTSLVGGRRPLDPSDTTGMVLPSPVDEGPLPWHRAVPLSGHHEERSLRPATRSRCPGP